MEILCPNPEHHIGGACTRHRAIHLMKVRFGSEAPLAFLGCWYLKAHEKATKKDHKDYKPSIPEMTEYLKTYGRMATR